MWFNGLLLEVTTRFMTSDGLCSEKHHECGIRKCGIPCWKLPARPFQEGMQKWGSLSFLCFKWATSYALFPWISTAMPSPWMLVKLNLCCSETHHHIHKAQTLCCQPGSQKSFWMQMKINASWKKLKLWAYQKKTLNLHHFKASWKISMLRTPCFSLYRGPPWLKKSCLWALAFSMQQTSTEKSGVWLPQKRLTLVWSVRCPSSAGYILQPFVVVNLVLVSSRLKGVSTPLNIWRHASPCCRAVFQWSMRQLLTALLDTM